MGCSQNKLNNHRRHPIRHVHLRLLHLPSRLNHPIPADMGRLCRVVAVAGNSKGNLHRRLRSLKQQPKGRKDSSWFAWRDFQGRLLVVAD
jgi:hypothetical protein